jgi:hypothetical protein
MFAMNAGFDQSGEDSPRIASAMAAFTVKDAITIFDEDNCDGTGCVMAIEDCRTLGVDAGFTIKAGLLVVSDTAGMADNAFLPKR